MSILIRSNMKAWLFSKYVANTANKSDMRVAWFQLNQIFLHTLTGFFHTGKIIQRSAILEAERQLNWNRLKNDKRYELYEPLFSKIHFFKDEVWKIKGHVYRVEAVHNLYEVDLVNIETYEKTNLEQLMPVAVEDVKYLRNLSYELTKMNIYLKGNYQVMTYEQFASCL